MPFKRLLIDARTGRRPFMRESQVGAYVEYSEVKDMERLVQSLQLQVEQLTNELQAERAQRTAQEKHYGQPGVSFCGE